MSLCDPSQFCPLPQSGPSLGVRVFIACGPDAPSFLAEALAQPLKPRLCFQVFLFSACDEVYESE